MAEEKVTCPDCGGSGKVTETNEKGGSREVKCGACDGKGTVVVFDK